MNKFPLLRDESSTIKKAIIHWVVVFVLIVVGLPIGHWLDNCHFVTQFRYKVYRFQQSLSPRRPYAEDTVLVLIGDDEYWKGELGARVPIKRDYLAKLVSAVAKNGPAVVALDFDMRSPVPQGGLLEHPDYEQETKELIQVITETAESIHIVLPKAFWYSDDGDDYIFDSDIFGDLCDVHNNIHGGYIQFNSLDARRIPIGIPIEGRDKSLDSFAQAIVRAKDPRPLVELDKFPDDDAPYTGYLAEEAFGIVMSGDLLRDPKAFEDLIRGNIVIIGGAWSREAHSRGDRVDLHETPLGWLPGPLVHANYVEAILDKRFFAPVSDNVRMSAEVAFAVGIAIVLWVHLRTLWKVLLILLLCATPVVISDWLFKNLGLYFDSVVPTVLLVGHVVVERVREWYIGYKQYQSLLETKS